MAIKIFEQEYKINSVNINANKELGLVGLLEILQDVASEHAENLGVGYDSMQEKGAFWVLIRKKLKMKKFPKWRDSITIKTWILPAKKLYRIREFEIYDKKCRIGSCSMTWLVLDRKTRKPKVIDESEYSYVARTDYSLDFTANKVTVPDKLNIQKKFEVNISDLDVNNHVNNTKYAQWILDSIPLELHKKYSIIEYEIKFLNETFIGDKIICSNNADEIINNEMYFRGENSKTIFLAKLKLKQ